MGGRLLRQCTAARMVPTARRASALLARKALIYQYIRCQSGGAPSKFVPARMNLTEG